MFNNYSEINKKINELSNKEYIAKFIYLNRKEIMKIIYKSFDYQGMNCAAATGRICDLVCEKAFESCPIIQYKHKELSKQEIDKMYYKYICPQMEFEFDI